LLNARPPARAVAEKLLRQHGFRDAARIWPAVQRLAADATDRHGLAKIFTTLVRHCAASADPDRALINFERLLAALPNPAMFYEYLAQSDDSLALLVRVFAHSQSLTDTLTRNAAYLHFLIAPATLAAPRAKKAMTAELDRLLLTVRARAEQCDVVRRFRRRETLRIGARDLAGKATVEETTAELANLADVCLQAVFDITLAELTAEYRLPPAALPVTKQFAVIGMGKLGGQELNYSSDVDVIFVYHDEVQLTPTLTTHEFFTRLAERIIKTVGRATEEGSIFRIDLRLRPEGAAGPLVCSLEAAENYYAERGETWERMALLKARLVAGDPTVGDQFIRMVQPFVYARLASTNVIEQMAVIKQRIEREIVTEGRLGRHVKLGIGGIREIEFIVQSFQVLRGARQPALRDRSTLPALVKLAQAGLLRDAEAKTLADAYRFLRNVEHRLQMEMELQTHTIPDEEQAVDRLARGLGFAGVEEFQQAQERYRQGVRGIYSNVLAGAVETKEAQPETLSDAVLTAAGFADVPGALKVVASLQHGAGIMHVSERTKTLFAQMWPTVLAALRETAEPDVALRRLEQFVNAYGSRSLLYELLGRHPRLVELLVRVGDASRFMAETLVREPDLFDSVCRGGALNEPKRMDRLCAELVASVTANPDRPAMDVVREWKRAELLRIGIEDVLGLVDVEQSQREMTCVAEVCLRFALHEARRQLKRADLPLAIIGLGKCGGEELGYGADLDVLFVGGHGASDQAEAVALAVKVIELMSQRTEAGMLYVVDARLRPDGEKGVLASSLAAHADYYRQRGELWERQALTKARFVAGDEGLGRQFIALTQEVVYGRGLTGEELTKVRRMRDRVATERGDQRQVRWEFKTGPGGLMDIEFLVQALQLQHGHAHPALRTPHTLNALNRLTALGLVEEEDSAWLRRQYLFLRKIESVLRRQEDKGVSRLPGTEHEQALLARRLGCETRERFLGMYDAATQGVRQVYARLMGEPSA
jgi:glutamate-ammonia-ligase adenylyltransferase